MRRAVATLLAIGMAFGLATPARAGGSWGLCGNPPAPIKYAGAGTVTLNYDQGTLGARSKAQADALVTEAVTLWTSVPTATVTLAHGPDLAVDVTVANYSTYANSFSDGLNPVIYDTDGSIVDSYIGAGAKNNVLGFAGSAYSGCQYVEGRAIISGYINVTETKLKVVIAHEIGHLIGLDHTQIDNEQGLASGSYPLMYPIANRNQVSLHEDDVAAASMLYPDAVAVANNYGQLTGTFTEASGTPIRGANLWATENTSNMVYSVVSDILMRNTGYFKLLLPPGTYTLHAGAIRTTFTGGSSVGPYAELASDPSFQSPLRVNGVAMTPLTLGNASPVQITILAGCAASASFLFDGTGSVVGNCVANHTVSFNSNGGSAVSSQTVANNSTAALPAAPSKAGSAFAGWYSDAGLTIPFNFATAITGNTTLYAKWALNNYTVSFNSNGGSAVAGQIVPYNGTAALPAVPGKTGSTFAGWYSDAGLATAFNFTTAITGNTTLYAKWTLNNYTVSFNSNGGSAVASQIVPYNGNAALPAAPDKAGSTFAGWYSDAGLTSAFNFATAITGNNTLYAKWTLNNYALSFNSNGGSAVSSQIVAHNGNASVPAAPTRAGFRFAGWYSDAALNSKFDFATAITSNTTLHAKWTRIDLTPIIMLLLD